MRRPLVLSLLVIAGLPIPTRAGARYVGVQACARCHDSDEHGSPLESWRASRHAGAFATLKTHSEGKARDLGDLQLWIVEIGRGVRYGLPKPAAEAKECLPCHTAAFGADPRHVAPSFDPRDGVQCESCHGPGSDHAGAMAAKAGASASAGLTRYQDERAIEARCRTCHEGTCGDFDFATMWPAVRHSRPESRAGR